MTQFQVGDRVKWLPKGFEKKQYYGNEGTITYIDSRKTYVKFDIGTYMENHGHNNNGTMIKGYNIGVDRSKWGCIELINPISDIEEPDESMYDDLI